VPEIRARICSGLAFIGIQLDASRNRKNEPVISRDGSPVTVRVIRTDEELIIAKTVCRILELNRNKGTRS
jgi:acetate kinase